MAESEKGDADMTGGPDVRIPPDWDDAAAQVADAAARRVLVLGAADVGKSTFCRFLLGHLRARGRRTALLTTDVGQKTVGPPACLTLAGADRSALFFVGTTDPVRGWRRILDGTGVLLDATESDVTVINTSGLLAGPGRRLKADKIAVVRPDLLMALGSGSDLERVVGDHASVPVVRLTECSQSAVLARKLLAHPGVKLTREGRACVVVQRQEDLNEVDGATSPRAAG
jgi:polynucleotide 5'-hydroxyl-kinase GRC3/NOL9